MSTQLDYPIIDVDVHIHEESHDLAEFADDDWLKRTLELESPNTIFLDEPGYSPLTTYDPPLDDDPNRAVHLLRDAAQLRAELDQRAVDAAILYTGRLLNVSARPDPNYGAGMMRTYNRYLRARWLNPADGLYGAIMVAAQAPIESAREIEHWAQDSAFAAIFLPMASIYPLWGHPQYEPIFAAAQEVGLPVVLQGFTHVYTVFPYQLSQFDTALAKQMLAKPFGAMANFASLVTSGTLARFPKLKVVFTEIGFAWLLPMLWRLDHQAEWLPHEIRFYDAKPSQAVMQQVYVTTHSLEAPNSPSVIAALVEEMRLQDRLLFASDYPHYDADSVERVVRLPLTNEVKRKILRDNSLATFRLPQVRQRYA